MITTTQTKNRIDQLITLDKQTDTIHSRYNARLLQYIASHLNQFYDHYATDNGLDLNTASQELNSWDVDQWNQALSQFNPSTWPVPAKARLAAYAAAAHIDNKHMLTAIIAVGLIANTVITQRHILDRIAQDGITQGKFLHHYLNDSAKADRDGLKIVTKNRLKPKWIKTLWSHPDNIADDVETLVNKKIRKGMTAKDLDKLLTFHANPAMRTPNTSIADRVAQLIGDAGRITRTESASEINDINRAIYIDSGVREVDIVNMPGACVLCQDLAADNPYDIMDYPNLPYHINCRCSVTVHSSPLITHAMLF